MDKMCDCGIRPLRACGGSHSLKLGSRYIDFVEIRWEAEMDQHSSLRAVMIAMFLVALFIVGIYAGQHIGLLPRM
ncbi:hypothetical protein ELI24_09075 [Rhizobium ruizarguesonis]|nr:hypothetical protein ELI24_09075 [Rhizobium ruizarguesonis]